MIRVLSNVKLDNLQPQMVLAVQIIATRSATCIITAGSDGKHMIGSKHYTGKALDFRVHHLFTEYPTAARALALQGWAQGIREDLGSCFDVILEDVNEANEHLHVEYDPKPTPVPSEPV